VNFSVPTFTASETRSPAIITVNRSGPTAGTVLVDFSTQDGTAVAGADYTAVSRTLTFAPGVRTQTVSVPILQDTLAEGTETVNLQLLNVRGGTPPALLGVRSTAVLQITDEEDKGGNLQFNTSTYLVKEPAAGQTAVAVITVTRSGGTASGVTVDYQATDGPAAERRAGGHELRADLRPAHVRGRPDVADVHGADSERYLCAARQSADRGVVADEPAGRRRPRHAVHRRPEHRAIRATVAFTQSQFVVLQSVASAPIVVRRSGNSAGPVTVNYSTTTGPETTAVPRRRLPPGAGVLTFPTSNTTMTFSVPILNNPNGSGARKVGVAITAGTGIATIVEPRTATLTINQAAVAGVIEFASSTFEVAENVAGGLATVGVIRSGGTLGGVTVNYATSDNGPCPAPAGAFYACAGSDYTTTTGTVTFGPGETFKTFTVPILNDAAVEGVEALTLSLSSPQPADSGVRLGVRSTAQLKIVDDELALGFSATNYTIGEAGGSVTIKVELTACRPGR
jgi:hypothetical protein